MADRVRVGGRLISLVDAAKWIDAYFAEDANRHGTKPYAYPYYDRMSTGSDPDELNDGDLLAPTLLNVRMSIAAFRSLQSVRAELEEGLARIPAGLTLDVAVAQGRHQELLAGIVGVLDHHELYGVNMTTLSKVLHRKRPAFMPLYDSHVRACYVGSGSGYPIARAAYRTMQWVEAMGTLAACIADDLTSQARIWDELADGLPVSRLRLIDVVAWRAGARLG
ncbi:MAG TPA: DUF6308 family protein [Actinospica sp.]|nr:DUF6308 family protein [Actinospica sp.]